MRKEFRFIFALLFLTCLPVTYANAASVPVFSFTGGVVGSGPLVDNVTIGYGFNINRSDIWVTDIGWFDHLGDGLAADHAVKLWDSSMSEILSVIIGAGTGTLEDGFRYMTLSSPIYLAPGDYVIGGTANSTLDPYIGKTTSSSNWGGVSPTWIRA